MISSEQAQAFRDAVDDKPRDHWTNGARPRDSHWLDGEPLNPLATPGEPLVPVPGFPFIVPGTTTTISGPTGGGRSMLIEACLYDAARAGLRCAYLGMEVTKDEFDARCALIAAARGDDLDDALIEALRNVRYLDLVATIARAWNDPAEWVAGVVSRYQVLGIDPLSAVASTLDLDFDRTPQYLRFHDRLVEPIKLRGVPVVLVDNIGHSEDASHRPSGASGKINRPDLTFACKETSAGLVVRCTKVRGVRVPWKKGDRWLFARDDETIVADTGPAAGGSACTEPTRRTWYMEQVSRALELDADGDGARASSTKLREAVGRKATYVDGAVLTLVAEGHVEDRRSARPRYVVLRPYRQADDPESGRA